MATIILQAVGSYLAGPVGAAIGAIAGTAIDRALIGGPRVTREGPRLSDLSVQNSSFGEPIALAYGTVRLAGNIIWSSGLIERRSEQTQGGKSGSVTTTSYSYFASFAVAISARPINSIGRIWADGKLIRTADGTLLPGGTMRLHQGFEDQVPDSLIEAAVGLSDAPAHRGMAYVVFEELPLADFANRIPNLTFEVSTEAGNAALPLSEIVEDVTRRAGLSQVVCSNLGVPVRGFAVGRDSSAAAVIDSLQPLGPLVYADRQGVLSISSADPAAQPILIDATRLGAQVASKSEE